MAVQAKAKGPASDNIMTPDKMKPLLALSKQEPVQAAVGLTADGEGLILLHKKMKPKKVLSTLRAEAGKAKLQLNNSSLRFGRAEVDTEYDPGMVRFFLNKDAPGNMRVKLVEVVKRIPYQKVEINVDPSLEAEPEDDLAEQTEDAVGTAPVTAETTAAPPPPAPPPPALDAATLKRELAGLIGRIVQAAGEDAARKAQLVQLATDANGAFKANNLAVAAQSLVRLREAIDNVGGGGDTGDLAKEFSAACADWGRAVAAVDAQMAALKKALIASGDVEYEEIAESQLAGVLGRGPQQLTAILGQSGGGDAAALRAAAGNMLSVLTNVDKTVLTNPAAAVCEANPVQVPVAIRATLGPPMARLRALLIQASA